MNGMLMRQSRGQDKRAVRLLLATGRDQLSGLLYGDDTGTGDGGGGRRNCSSLLQWNVTEKVRDGFAVVGSPDGLG